MKTKDIWTLQAFLVALVELPASESAPTVDKTLLNDPINTVARLRKLGQHHHFWTLYDQARPEFFNRYEAKAKNKAILPTGSPSEASSSNNGELGNISISASIVEESFQQLDKLFEENLRENFQQSYAEFQQNPPKALEAKSPTVFDWAEHLCNSYYAIPI